MKDIIKLIPIDKPVEGMQVVAYGSIFKCTETERVIQPGYIWLNGNGKEDWVNVKDCYQIVIEYQTGFGKDSKEYYVHAETLPLHPEDWDKALPLIGKEVDWVHDGWDEPYKFVEVAKLILPKQEESWDDIHSQFSEWLHDGEGMKENSAFSNAHHLMTFLNKFYHPPKPKQ